MSKQSWFERLKMRKRPPVHAGGLLRLYFDGSCPPDGNRPLRSFVVKKVFHDRARFARARRAFEPPDVGQDSLRTVLFSGFPALIYQLTWQRELFRIFGVNIESVTIVVTAFILGLGIGSVASGWISKKRESNSFRCWRPLK